MELQCKSKKGKYAYVLVQVRLHTHMYTSTKPINIAKIMNGCGIRSQFNHEFIHYVLDEFLLHIFDIICIFAPRVCVPFTIHTL